MTAKPKCSDCGDTLIAALLLGAFVNDDGLCSGCRELRRQRIIGDQAAIARLIKRRKALQRLLHKRALCQLRNS
jgi:hypothetical protein